MIVRRWQAPIVPDIKQIMMMFQVEGLTPYEEVVEHETTIPDHRHPFDEVRMVAQGELHINISGTQLLLRAGDRILIPSNTRHSKSVKTPEDCICVCATKTF